MSKIIEQEIIEVTKSKAKNKAEDIVIRFAWGNEKLKTWFITKTPKAILPKGSRLLFRMDCSPTNEPITITDTYPKQGQIINDVDSRRLRVITVK